MAICLRLSVRRQVMLNRHRIATARRKYIVVLSFSVCRIPFETVELIELYLHLIAALSQVPSGVRAP